MKRVLMICYPGRVEPGIATTAIVETADISPTLVDLCHFRAPKNRAGRSLRRYLMFLWIWIAACAVIPPAHAWNSVGHRTIAELAWRQMDKQERRAASELLKQHPHYAQILAADVPAGVDTNEWVFLTAAVWPDLVRNAKPGQPQKPHSITKYDLYPHAVGYPFMRPAESNATLMAEFYIEKPDAEMVLSNSIATLKDRKTSAHDRAVALCWTLHLFGDLHQPLHTASWLRTDREGWDGLGGNYVVIDPRGKPEQIDLHSFWDRLGGTDGSYKAIASTATRLATTRALNPHQMKEYQKNKTIHAWVQESYALAVNVAYAENRVRFAHIDDLHSGKVKPADVPLLSPQYIRDAEAIADRRIVLAGQRLTDVLKKVW